MDDTVKTAYEQEQDQLEIEKVEKQIEEYKKHREKLREAAKPNCKVCHGKGYVNFMDNAQQTPQMKAYTCDCTNRGKKVKSPAEVLREMLSSKR